MSLMNNLCLIIIIYYTCKTCNKCFSRSGNLKKHEQIHNRDKPYGILAKLPTSAFHIVEI